MKTPNWSPARPCEAVFASAPAAASPRPPACLWERHCFSADWARPLVACRPEYRAGRHEASAVTWRPCWASVVSAVMWKRAQQALHPPAWCPPGGVAACLAACPASFRRPVAEVLPWRPAPASASAPFEGAAASLAADRPAVDERCSSPKTWRTKHSPGRPSWPTCAKPTSILVNKGLIAPMKCDHCE